MSFPNDYALANRYALQTLYEADRHMEELSDNEEDLTEEVNDTHDSEEQ